MADAALALAPEDEEQVRAILISWRDEHGVENPVLPADVDIDGDGIVDGYGLGEGDKVIVVSGKPVEDTVFRSDGDGIVEGS